MTSNIFLCDWSSFNSDQNNSQSRALIGSVTDMCWFVMKSDFMKTFGETLISNKKFNIYFIVFAYNTIWYIIFTKLFYFLLKMSGLTAELTFDLWFYSFVTRGGFTRRATWMTNSWPNYTPRYTRTFTLLHLWGPSLSSSSLRRPLTITLTDTVKSGLNPPIGSHHWPK